MTNPTPEAEAPRLREIPEENIALPLNLPQAGESSSAQAMPPLYDFAIEGQCNCRVCLHIRRERSAPAQPDAGVLRVLLEKLVMDAVISASVEVPEAFSDRVVMRKTITENLTDAILALTGTQQAKGEG